MKQCVKTTFASYRIGKHRPSVHGARDAIDHARQIRLPRLKLASSRSAPKRAATWWPAAQTADAIPCRNGTFPFVTDSILGDTRSLTHVAGGLHSPKIRASGLRFAQKPGSCLFVNRP